jgi:hypothetical protein
MICVSELQRKSKKFSEKLGEARKIAEISETRLLAEAYSLS